MYVNNIEKVDFIIECEWWLKLSLTLGYYYIRKMYTQMEAILSSIRKCHNFYNIFII